MPPSPVAELREATKRYGQITALEPLTFAIEPGTVTALLGPNGAGKTTTVKLLLGLTRPSAGSVRLFGVDPRSLAARRRTGVMLQIAKVPETLRVGEHLDLFRSYYPAPMPAADALDAAGLTALVDRKYGELSGGQKQRAQFALAICGNPDLLFLDEPTVGLDVESRRAFWQQVRALAGRGRAVVLTTHYLDEADALADRIVVLSRGRVVADAAPAGMKSLAAARRIRCVTSLQLERIEAMEDVHSVRRDGAATEILTNDAESVSRVLLNLDLSLTGLEVTGAGLEEAFLALTTGREPEDPRLHAGHVPAGGVR
jgi:ABC-2 type transport system ATP-binding protein